MKVYAFYDTDIYGNEEYDIRGDHYKELLRICCCNSSVLGLKYLYPDLAAADTLKVFEIPKPENITVFSDSGSYCCVKFYRVCPELCNAMMGIAGGIFENIKMNPDGTSKHNTGAIQYPLAAENYEDFLNGVDSEYGMIRAMIEEIVNPIISEYL